MTRDADDGRGRDGTGGSGGAGVERGGEAGADRSGGAGADADRTLARVDALQRTGAGLVAGAVLLVAFAGGLRLLPELAALLVAALGVAVTVAERRADRLRGLSIGLVGAALFLLVDRQLDPVGATVVRSAAVTAAIGVAVLVAALAIEADVPERLGGR